MMNQFKNISNNEEKAPTLTGLLLGSILIGAGAAAGAQAESIVVRNIRLLTDWLANKATSAYDWAFKK